MEGREKTHAYQGVQSAGGHPGEPALPGTMGGAPPRTVDLVMYVDGVQAQTTEGLYAEHGQWNRRWVGARMKHGAAQTPPETVFISYLHVYQTCACRIHNRVNVLLMALLVIHVVGGEFKLDNGTMHCVNNVGTVNCGRDYKGSGLLVQGRSQSTTGGCTHIRETC